MENLNAEEVKRALEICAYRTECDDCPIKDTKYCSSPSLFYRELCALINSKEQKIFELENRLKECENGYDGTLFLDRCKLHDAEEKVKELTEEYESMAKSVNEASDLIRKLKAEKKELTDKLNQQEIAYNELYELCENYRRELGEVRVALAEANNEKKELTDAKNEVFEKGAENLGRLEEDYLKLEADNLKLTEENEKLAQRLKIQT